VQRVVLEGPTILTYERVAVGDEKIRVPDEFMMARKATIYIKTDPDGDHAQMTAVLDGGMKFPRKSVGGWEGGVEATQFGPLPLQSQIREDTKFMDITRLKALDEDMSKSTKINNLKKQLVEDDQIDLYLNLVEDGLKGPSHQYVFNAGSDVYYLSIAGKEAVQRKGDRLMADSGSPASRSLHLSHERGGVPTLNANAGLIRVRAQPGLDGKNMNVTIELSNLVLHEPEGDVPRAGISQAFSVPMPAPLQVLNNATPQDYASADPDAPGTRQRMMREIIVLRNNIASEMHVRAAFAFSCLILCLVGWGLGLLFKWGNFLSAFALSFVPAMLCITLIIAGQRTCGNIPQKFWEFQNPLRVGIAIIWSGNALVSAIAVGLLGRLQRQ
jgi:hypothetical protein